MTPFKFCATILLLASGSHFCKAEALVLSPVDFSSAASFIVAASANPAIDNAPFLTPPGFGFDGVAALIVHKTTGDFLCSGALIAQELVLTAAHCLTDNTGAIITT